MAANQKYDYLVSGSFAYDNIFEYEGVFEKSIYDKTQKKTVFEDLKPVKKLAMCKNWLKN